MMERRGDLVPPSDQSAREDCLLSSDRIFRSNILRSGLRILAYPSDFTPYTSVDKIAEFFVNLTLDLVDRTMYSMEKNTPQGKDRIRDLILTYFDSEKEAVGPLLDSILSGPSLEQVLQENYIFLAVFRRKYRNMIRGVRPHCWKEVMKAVSRNLPECETHETCWAGGVESLDLEGKLHCELYRENWGGTKLAITGREDLRRDPSTLIELVYDRCKVIKDFTDPEMLRQFLAREYWQQAEDPERRTVSGLIIRILTDFIDYCLLNLSRNLELPHEKGFYLLRSPIFRVH